MTAAERAALRTKILEIRGRLTSAPNGPWIYREPFETTIQVGKDSAKMMTPHMVMQADEMGNMIRSVAVLDISQAGPLIAGARRDIPFLCDALEKILDEMDKVKR